MIHNEYLDDRVSESISYQILVVSRDLRTRGDKNKTGREMTSNWQDC